MARAGAPPRPRPGEHGIELALFPLNTVLFPGGRLPLRIFETRYMDMAKACLKDGTPFGVCLIVAGKEVGEQVWRLPLSDAYDKLLKSKIADMKNIGGPNAGSITAAQFLHRFVENKTPWAHLDIAGVAWQDGEQKPLSPGWGVGWGVRVLDRLVADHYEK